MANDELGTLMSDDFGRASLGANYTVGGTNRFSMQSGGAFDGMLLAQGAGALTDYIRYNPHTSGVEKWLVTADIYPQDKGAETWGVGFGAQSTNPFDHAGMMASAGLSSAANGRIAIFTLDGTPTQGWVEKAGSAGGCGFSPGDHLRLTFERDRFAYSATLENITTQSSVSCQWDAPLIFQWNPTNNRPENVGQYAIWAIGGSQIVTHWDVYSAHKLKPQIIAVGDSITSGFYGMDGGQRYVDLVLTNPRLRSSVVARASSTTQQILDYMPELVALSPKYLFLMIAGNDVLYGVPSGTWQANYASIVSQLKAAGIVPVHLLPTPRGTTDLRALKDWIIANYSGVDTVIDTWTPLLSGAYDLAAAYDPGDHVHPNAVGHAAIAGAIQAEAPYLNRIAFRPVVI
ncbi:MAG: SGNH/GDSL hydrolase family protein [Syntrophobacteraceae bacterium]